MSMFFLSHSISQSLDSSSGCFVSSEVRSSGREGKRSSIVILHGSPRAWVYGLGQNWSLQIQFLSLAQSLSVAFLSKRLHLAALIQSKNFPFSNCGEQSSDHIFVWSKLYFKVTEAILPNWLLITGIIIPTLFYVILFFWYIRDKRYSFMSCICILIFGYSAPSIPKYWYCSVLRWEVINQRRLSGSVRNA